MDKGIHNELTINGVHYTREALQAHVNKQLSGAENWQKYFHEFISFWIDEAQTSIGVSTSGSTGKPKTIRIHKSQMTNSARRTIDFFNLQKNDRALLCLPVQYIAGKMMVARAFVGGLHLLTVPPSSSPLRELTVNEPIDFCAMTPMQAHYSLNDPASEAIFRQIGTVIIGGGQISDNLRKLLKTYPNHIYETYGMTETISHIAVRKVSETEEEDFFVLPGIEIDTDEHHCLVIEAPDLGYQSLRTRDIVSITRPGHFTWKGRLDNVINSGGIKIYPEQMEEALTPLIGRRFVISALNDEILGQRLVLVLEREPMDPGLEEELITVIRQGPDFAVYPKTIACLQPFPETGTGKIDRIGIMETINSKSMK